MLFSGTARLRCTAKCFCGETYIYFKSAKYGIAVQFANLWSDIAFTGRSGDCFELL